MKSLSFLVLFFITMECFAMQPVNFKNLTLPSSPNKFLVCPKDFCNVKPNRESATYQMRANDLKKVFTQAALNEPRVTITSTSDDSFQIQFVQRSFLFRFPDYIDVCFIPITENTSTLAIYSRAKYGHSDFGVNKKRVLKWLNLISDHIHSQQTI